MPFERGSTLQALDAGIEGMYPGGESIDHKWGMLTTPTFTRHNSAHRQRASFNGTM
jgi:hypothetical protein